MSSCLLIYPQPLLTGAAVFVNQGIVNLYIYCGVLPNDTFSRQQVPPLHTSCFGRDDWETYVVCSGKECECFAARRRIFA